MLSFYPDLRRSERTRTPFGDWLIQWLPALCVYGMTRKRFVLGRWVTIKGTRQTHFESLAQLR